MNRPLFDQALEAVRQSTTGQQIGKITAIHGLVIEAKGCNVQQGELVEIVQARTGCISLAEVVGLNKHAVLLMPFESAEGLCLDSVVIPLGRSLGLQVSEKMLGRVINPLGEAFDAGEPIELVGTSIYKSKKPVNPLHRKPIQKMLQTGVKSIDLFTPIGRGQRIGIFAGSGVGKSTLLGMVAKSSMADVIVIALVGERGREVGDFINSNLGAEGLKRSVLVVATAGDTAVMKRQAAYSATAVAEWFRDQGKDVLLIMDSITRFVLAQREIGISVGEPIGARGFPASVFALLAPLLERPGGIVGKGTITAVYTVLVEGDDLNEPVSDFMRSMLDGHIVLSRRLASEGVYPATDIVKSISRLAGRLQNDEEVKTAQTLRKLLSHYEHSRELIEMGVYKDGSSTKTDASIKYRPKILSLLSQAAEKNLDIMSARAQAKLLSDQALKEYGK